MIIVWASTSQGEGVKFDSDSESPGEQMTLFNFVRFYAPSRALAAHLCFRAFHICCVYILPLGVIRLTIQELQKCEI